MTRTITALYDSRSEAESARERLSAANVDASRVQILDQSSGASSSGSSSSGSSGGGFWSSVKDAFMPDEDRHAYEEGMRRGGYLLCARVDEDDADEAIRILEQTNSIDFDERQQNWKSEGWQPYSGSMGSAGMGAASGMSGTTSGAYENRTEGRTVEEEHIPIVEEQLLVGKREVNRGGARVRSYVRETPVHEQVNLRDEHVSVERRPVDQRIEASDGLADSDLLRERTIEMTETDEVPMVSKEARVTEEVVVRKTAEEHMEDVEDTVRRTEVDVDEGVRSESDRSAFGFDNDRQQSSSETSRSEFERTDRSGDYNR
ncbi:MAG TPA: YsnF/AvaK domain-containing protein [Allosphingosinicella sp.]|uniref:YsnF/AvaK domain-containing protein n=1 Tax=Allosphingosinicella sp. TaxID=2823234 RepID=UPI002EDA5F2F